MIWVILLAIWLGGWALNVVLVHFGGKLRAVRIAAPLVFGATVLAIWQVVVTHFAIPPATLPAPSVIAAEFMAKTDVLWGDFVQTVVKGGLSGYVIGCTAAFLAAVMIDRSPFLARGLLPMANFLAALPIVGIAPIMVNWFGFGWESKAAVVVLMVFFPMFVNTMAGLQAADTMQKDLMRTYGASYGQTMTKLRLPAALPFIFNGLKICTTLALIGAIVAEYFGSPTYGMGFRISTEMGRFGLDMVWAEIFVAALAGSAFFGLISIIEKGATFWHPSQRG
jgi:NitT/TauT family transport system permease protein